MVMDIDTPSNTPYWAPNFLDTEQIALRQRHFDTPSYMGIPPHYDPYNPEKRFSSWTTFSKPGPPSPPFDPEYIRSRDFSSTYPGDITKYHPFDPENFDPESFFFGGSSPSSAEPAEPQDPKLLDAGFDDQYPAIYAPLTAENYHLYGFSETYPGDPTKYTPFDPENFDAESFFFGPKFNPCDPAGDPKPLDVCFDDQSPAKVDPVDPEIGVLDKKFVDNSKGTLTNVGSSGTAANKWNKKESSSSSKVAWNTLAEEETWESTVGEELSRKTGYFARKCSLGADGSKSGGPGCGRIGRALCTRMP